MSKRKPLYRFLIFTFSVFAAILIPASIASSTNTNLNCVEAEAGPCTGLLPGSWCDNSGQGIVEILNLILNVLTAGVGVLVILGLVISAIQWLTARDNTAQTIKAKNRILNVVIGALSWSILWVFANWLIPGFTATIAMPVSPSDPEPIVICTPKEGSSSSSPNTSFVPGNLEVFFVNVGNANNIVIRSKTKVAIIDAGTPSGEECPDVTKASRFIKALGITKTDAMIATHYHGDHVKAIPSVYKVAPFSVGYGPSATLSTKGENCGLHPMRGSKYKQLKMGDTLDIFGGEFTIEVVGPALVKGKTDECIQGDGKPTRICGNYASLNLLVHHNDITFFLTGDQTMSGQLLKAYPASKLKANVLNLPHHSLGNGGLTKALVDAVNPQFAVSNSNNLYIRNNSDKMSWLKNAKIVWTGKNKHMVFVSDGKSLKFFDKIDASNYKR